MNNRIMVAALFAGLVMAGSVFAGDRGGRMDRHPPRGPQEPGLQLIQHLGKAVRRLDLSEEQRVAIRDEFSVFKENVKPLMQELHGGRKALHEVITSDTYDAEAAAEIAAQQGQLTAEIATLASDVAAAVLSRLDETQRAELQAMGEERRMRRETHREDFRARKQERKEARRKEGSEGN